MPKLSKDQELLSQWKATKIEMLVWIQKSIAMMEPGSSAKDVESMVNATAKLLKMVGDVDPQAKEGLDEKDLLSASKRISRAAHSFKGIFANNEDDDEEDDDDDTEE